MPHSAKSLVDVFHDLRWRIAPAQLKQFLPDVASISMYHSLRDAAKKLVNHDSFVFFGNRVKRFLDHVASKGVHAKAQGISSNSIGNGGYLLRSSMLKTALHQEVSKSIYHKRVGLSYDSFNYLIFLFDGAYFELLL